MGKASEIPELNISGDWLHGGNDTYYYPLPVEPSASTPNLLTTGYTLRTDTYNGVTVYQVVEFLGEAVQAEPGTAVTEAWGMTVEKGKIVTVSKKGG